MSFQDRANHHISQLDKEVSHSSRTAIAMYRPVSMLLGLLNTAINTSHDKVLELTHPPPSCPATQPSRTSSNRAPCQRSTSSSDSAPCTLHSSSSTSPENSSSMSLVSSFQDTTPSRRCSAPALPMILSGLLYVPAQLESSAYVKTREQGYGSLHSVLMICRSTGSALAS